MDARVPRTTNWDAVDLSPPKVFDDIELIEWGSTESFRRQRAEWLRDVRRQGGMKLGPMREIITAVADYMSPKNDAAWPSRERLAADLGWSLSSVKRALTLAIAWGWLTRSRRPNSSNEYRMSYSHEVRSLVVRWHADRIADFEARAATKKEAGASSARLRSEPSESPDVSHPTAQVRAVHGVRPEPLTCPVSSFIDPEDRSETERLGEAEQDMASGFEQKKASRDEVISILGRGDVEAGEQVAATLGPARLGYLVSLVDQEGMVGAHRAILEARNSVAPHH
ncbi:hypothetical protein FQV39_03220 [Bosea sp. F3-2]|uniref:hypothetical protein n=1 Tax=Bosea sp. F3-2 TaxID=2599640 RepID=UPI0011EC7853|nr:hypothetical protein [Bosea sp. F3-2]QEL21700.1 hypothetical protein FQV39_03220 [Bosea sp. F3-2]